MQNLIEKYLLKKTNATHIQFFRYLFVGGLATLVDLGIFHVVNNILAWHYTGAKTAAFIGGLIANYIMSIIWVFKRTKNFKKEFSIFAVVGIGGLLWSFLLLWLFIDVLGITYFKENLANAMTIFIVLFWNFFMRKKFAFEEKVTTEENPNQKNINQESEVVDNKQEITEDEIGKY